MPELSMADAIDKSNPQSFLSALCKFQEAYDRGEPIISDAEYDELEQEFKERYPDWEDKLPIGYTIDEFEKVEHEIPMGSLDKIHSQEEVEDWEREYSQEILYQWKFDGLAVEAIYEDGVLQQMLTRGDGVEGEDVTHVGKVSSGIPNAIPQSANIPDGKLILRGEAVLHKEDHPNEARRNLATGTVKSLDADVARERNLQIYIHSIAQWPTSYTDIRDVMGQLESANFQTSETFQDIANYQTPWKELQYDVDGIVVKTKDGSDAIAYKFPNDTFYTTVKGMEWSIGKTKKITPVLKVKPVKIDGRELENVSLGSYRILEDSNIGVGDEVEVTFANDVIPHLESVVDRTDSERFDLDACPECGGEVVFNGAHLFCDNEECDSGAKLHFEKVLDRMEVDGLGDEGMEQLGELYEWDIVRFIESLNISDMLQLEGWGEKTAKKVYYQIQETVEELTWFQLFYIPAIDHFGEKSVKKYVEQNEGDLWPFTANKLYETDGIDDARVPDIIRSFEQHKETVEILRELATISGRGLTRLGIVKSGAAGHELTDIKVYVTGGLNHFSNRDEFREFVEAHGGHFGKSKDSILIANKKSSSSKYQYAEDNDLPIKTEEEFLEDFNLMETAKGWG